MEGGNSRVFIAISLISLDRGAASGIGKSGAAQSRHWVTGAFWVLSIEWRKVVGTGAIADVSLPLVTLHCSGQFGHCWFRKLLDVWGKFK